MMAPSRPPLTRLLVADVQELVSRGERYLGCLWVSARRTSRQRELVLSLGKMFGMSVGWFGGWATSYVLVGMII